MNYQKHLLSLFIFTLMFFAQTISARTLLRAGMIDTTFGTNGHVLTEIRTTPSFLYSDMASQPDGKIVVLCAVINPKTAYNVTSLLVIRYNSDGTIDNAFGVNGFKNIPVDPTPFSSYPTSKSAVKVQLDGKIIIVTGVASDYVILRLESNGDIDSTFGVNGIARTNFTGREELCKTFVQGFFLRPDGKILVYGYVDVDLAMFPGIQATYDRPAIAQYNQDGSLDTSFGVNGIQTSKISDSQQVMPNAIVQSDGKILIPSHFTWNPNVQIEYGVGLVRYNADGTIDRQFGSNGLFLAKNYSESYLPIPLYIPAPDGNILSLRGKPELNGFSYYRIMFNRYNSELSLDELFSPVTHVLLGGGISDIYVQPDGKIICATYSISFADGPYIHNSMVFRFNPDTTADISFGDNAASIFDLDNSSLLKSSIQQIIIQPDGNIIAAGKFNPVSGASAPKGIALVRLLGKNSKQGL
jgi:uncharacterized delta-60 repeat protein